MYGAKHMKTTCIGILNANPYLHTDRQTIILFVINLPLMVRIDHLTCQSNNVTKLGVNAQGYHDDMWLEREG